jgi:hypothetical protein
MSVRFFGGWVWSEGKKKCKGERERREILTHTHTKRNKEIGTVCFSTKSK